MEMYVMFIHQMHSLLNVDHMILHTTMELYVMIIILLAVNHKQLLGGIIKFVNSSVDMA